MKKLRILLLVVIIGIFSAAIFAYYLWNKPHKNVAEATPDKTFTSDALYNEVKTKDSIALAAYNNKVVQVTGKISKIEAPSDTVINIFLAVKNNNFDNISCAMDPKFFSRLKNLRAGDELTVKGLYAGENKFEDKDLGISMMDVDLMRCVAIRK